MQNVIVTLDLMRSFPTLRGFTENFDPDSIRDSSEFSEAFAKWSCGPAATSGSRYASQFVLAVWNGYTPSDP